ncbi:MAG: topoisomerase C-terminal repeat-containing protein [Lachnospiraceae bacterium]|nr:topoisomerase C-terminal repeat-containing protein [Lachnospiraceae bacterium]
MKALLIAEKPSLKRTIESVYNKHKSEIPYDITFIEQRGHLITLKSPDEIDEDLKEWSWDTLPIHPEEHGGWQYKIIPEKKTGNFLTAAERFKNIKAEIKSGKYDFIINAGDPDQEGELLVRIVLASIGTGNLPIKRYWSNATTEKDVLNALKNLRDDQQDPMLVNLLAAAYARQHSDYRFGMNLSRAASLKMSGNVACGRVKTPILAVVCKREEEIKNFKPKTTYGVKAFYSEGFDGSYIESGAIELDVNDEKSEEKANEGIVWFDNKQDAENLIASLADSGSIIKYETKKVESYAPKLYKLATAQIEAGHMGFTAQDTLDIIQGLYERGYLSYPRTDCEYMSSQEDMEAFLNSASSVPSLAPYIKTIQPETINKVRGTKKWCNDKELQKSGHSALIPTSKAPDFNSLSPEEQKIYEMVCKRFVAIFLPPLVQNKTLLIADISGKAFRSTGKTILKKGYTEIFGTESSDTIIPEHQVGDVLTVDEFKVNEKTTTCPKRFTDATLIAMCEAPHKYLEDESLKALGKKLSIGTPATRASIIEELISRNKYLNRMTEKKTTYIVPTDVGMAIYENLRDCDICKIDLTGEWEILLEQIRGGELAVNDMENRMRHDVERIILDIKNRDMKPLNTGRNMPICICPECGGEIHASQTRYFCSGYRENGCQVGGFTTIVGAHITPADFANLLNKKTIKKTLHSKGGSSWPQELYYNFDEHKIEFVPKEQRAATTTESECEYVCPRCSETLKESPKLFSCPECDFKFWKSTCGKALTEDQIRNFFETGDTGLVGGLKNPNNGNIFSAHIKLKADRSGTEFFYERKK